MEKDGRSSAMSEGEGLDEEDDDGDDDEEGGAETEEQSGNESEMNEQEEDVSPKRKTMCQLIFITHKETMCGKHLNNITAEIPFHTRQPLAPHISMTSSTTSHLLNNPS